MGMETGEEQEESETQLPLPVGETAPTTRTRGEAMTRMITDTESIKGKEEKHLGFQAPMKAP